MRNGLLIWTGMVVLGVLLWFVSLDGTPTPYRTALGILTFSWFGYVAWVPKRH